MTTRIASTSPYAPAIGFSAAVRSGPWVTTAGTTALNAAGQVIGATPYEQAREALRKIIAVLSEAGASAAHVVSTRIYVVRADDWEDVGRAHGEVFNDIRPAATMLVVAGLLDPRMSVEIEAVAYVAEMESMKFATPA